MRSLVTLLFFTISCCFGHTQSLSAAQVLERAIDYHDPNANWPTFNGVLEITMQTPKSSDRISTIAINLPKSYFKVDASVDSTTVTYSVDRDSCTALLNGSDQYSSEEAKKHRLNCERAKMYRNYYTYLYGLPMKLKDPGTIIHDEVMRKTFKGKEYVVIKASYDQGVGSDVWFFYFDPKTYAMEVYQFFKTDKNGQPDPNSGEYILLEEEKTVNGIKMPKIRAWYYNKNDQYLGTDILH